MSIYSLSGPGGVGTTGVASLELIAGTKQYKLLELGVFLTAATATTLGLGVPGAIGVTPTTPVTFLNENDTTAVASTVKSAIAWGTPPTAPTNFYRRIQVPATSGAGMVWQFPRGLQVAGSSSVVVWNLATDAVIAWYAVVEE